jgi:hypothetical protein
VGNFVIYTSPLILHRTFRWFIYVDNIKIELQEVGLGSMDWNDMAGFMGAIMNLFVL